MIGLAAPLLALVRSVVIGWELSLSSEARKTNEAKL